MGLRRGDPQVTGQREITTLKKEFSLGQGKSYSNKRDAKAKEPREKVQPGNLPGGVRRRKKNSKKGGEKREMSAAEKRPV